METTMTTAAHLAKPRKKASAPPNGQMVPPLQNGDHLTVAEFERRYTAMRGVKKAELIEGVVYMPSPVTFRQHGEPHNDFNGWVFVYKAFTPGVEAADNSTLRILIGENEPQPDVCLRINEDCGGQSRIDDDGYLEGSPEWLSEVSASTASFDLHKKLHTYEKNGVLEYVVWRVEDKEIDWFILKGGKYQRLAMTKGGLYKSKVFPGLWLDPNAMTAGDLIKVLGVVQKGVASAEHRRFVEKLRSKKK
jgi:Uma2 family endonuclease